jgi:signal transduction histidine kinase
MSAEDGRRTGRLRAFLSSIRFRLTLWFAAILALVMLVFSTFVYMQQSRSLQAATLARLQAKFSEMQAGFDFAAHELQEGHLTLPAVPAGAQPLLQQGDVIAVTGVNGSVIQSLGPLTASQVSQIAVNQIQASSQAGPIIYVVPTADAAGRTVNVNYFFLLAPISLRGNVIGYLALGSPVDPGGQLHRLLLTLIFGSLGTLAAALAAGYWMANRAMRPVKTITRTARHIGETDLSQRLDLKSTDELGELAHTFDQMLARLQAAFERMRRFTADASHELRTPLTIVNLEANRALAARRKPAEYARALEVIQSENEYMTRLVENLLALSRMDAGQASLSLEPLDLSDVVLEGLERLAPLAMQHGVKLEAADLPELTITADRHYLLNLVINLLENALKFSRQSTHPRVLVEIGTAELDDRKWASLMVSDNGPGIAPEHLPHLFERFYQADPSRARPEGNQHGLGGSGLGLSIVEWIVDAHGGQVKVESTPGQGSTFSVLLPLAQSTN